jgi:hypothetical protein
LSQQSSCICNIDDNILLPSPWYCEYCHGAKVDSTWASGDHDAAISYSKKANTWAWISATSGLIVLAFYVIFFVILGMFTL